MSDNNNNNNNNNDIEGTVEVDLDEATSHLQFDPCEELKKAIDGEGSGNNELFLAGSKPQTLEFKKLRFAAEEKTILHGITGAVQPGQLLAIMGSSGAGKTTLLNLLAGRMTSAGKTTTEGEILVNGKRRDVNTFRTESAYVLQEDLFFPDLTVRETIRFSASLRLPNSLSKEEVEERVNQIIAEIGLNKVADSRVGNELIRGISGGEKKRLNIGTELVTSPQIMFIDEPTSGLDSFNAQNIVGTLLRLARNGNRTILATIHQPRSSIYQMFDILLLLSDGKQVYTGPASQAIEYFSRIGYPCPSNFNPADFFIDLISLDSRTPERSKITHQRVDHLAKAFQEHVQGEGHKSIQLAPQSVTSSNDQLLEDTAKYASPYKTQLRALFGRSFKNLLREKANNIAMFSQTIVFSLLLGCIWLGIGDMDNSEEIRGIVGVLFFLLVNISFSGVFGILFVVPTEKPVIWKERASRTYQTSAYIISKMLSELPRSLLNSFIYVLITYYMIGLRAEFQYFIATWALIALTLLASEGIAYSVSALARDAQQAGAFVPVFIVTSMLFAGFFIGKDLIPVWLNWISYLSFLRYSFALLCQVQFLDRSLTPDCLFTGAGGFCPSTGEEVLAEYGLDELDWYVNLIALSCITLALRLLTYILLRRNGPSYNYTI